VLKFLDHRRDLTPTIARRLVPGLGAELLNCRQSETRLMVQKFGQGSQGVFRGSRQHKAAIVRCSLKLVVLHRHVLAAYAQEAANGNDCDKLVIGGDDEIVDLPDGPSRREARSSLPGCQLMQKRRSYSLGTFQLKCAFEIPALINGS